MQRVKIVQISWNKIYLKNCCVQFALLRSKNLKTLLRNTLFSLLTLNVTQQQQQQQQQHTHTYTHTHTHTERTVVFLLQKWLRLRATMLRYTYITYCFLLTCK